MPHVVFDGEADLALWAAAFEPVVVREGGDVLRAEQLYLEREARALLLESLVVEAGRKLVFYVRISRHERGSVTIRIDPLTHPERTPAVRRLVAEVAIRLWQRFPELRIRATNLVLPSAAGGPVR
jgi:hypothetical protein